MIISQPNNIDLNNWKIIWDFKNEFHHCSHIALQFTAATRLRPIPLVSDEVNVGMTSFLHGCRNLNPVFYISIGVAYLH